MSARALPIIPETLAVREERQSPPDPKLDGVIAFSPTPAAPAKPPELAPKETPSPWVAMRAPVAEPALDARAIDLALASARAERRDAEIEAAKQGQPMTDRHWTMILACARELAGPMADVWIRQAMDAGPSTLRDGIMRSKDAMGAFGEDFAKALRRHLRSQA